MLTEAEMAALVDLDIDVFLAVDEVVHRYKMSWQDAYKKVVGRPLTTRAFRDVNQSTVMAMQHLGLGLISDVRRAPSGRPLAYGGCSCECHRIDNYPPHKCCQDSLTRHLASVKIAAHG